MKEKKSGILGSSSSLAVIKNNLGLLIAFLVLCVGATAVLGDTFFAWKNFSNVIKQLSTNMFLACGMTLVIMLGGIDLSVGSVIAMEAALRQDLYPIWDCPPVQLFYWQFCWEHVWDFLMVRLPHSLRFRRSSLHWQR